jgi:hypothetical protein
MKWRVALAREEKEGDANSGIESRHRWKIAHREATDGKETSCEYPEARTFGGRQLVPNVARLALMVPVISKTRQTPPAEWVRSDISIQSTVHACESHPFWDPGCDDERQNHPNDLPSFDEEIVSFAVDGVCFERRSMNVIGLKSQRSEPHVQKVSMGDGTD